MDAVYFFLGLYFGDRAHERVESTKLKNIHLESYRNVIDGQLIGEQVDYLRRDVLPMKTTARTGIPDAWGVIPHPLELNGLPCTPFTIVKEYYEELVRIGLSYRIVKREKKLYPLGEKSRPKCSAICFGHYRRNFFIFELFGQISDQNVIFQKNFIFEEFGQISDQIVSK